MMGGSFSSFAGFACAGGGIRALFKDLLDVDGSVFVNNELWLRAPTSLISWISSRMGDRANLIPSF